MWAEVKQRFRAVLDQLSPGDRVSYYNFLLAGKRMAFKFAESEHLISLKRQFSGEGSSMDKGRLVELLEVEDEVVEKDCIKYYVRFRTDQFLAIKEAEPGEQDEPEEDPQWLNRFKDSTVALKLEDLERRLAPLQQALKILIQHKHLELLEIFDLDEDGRVGLRDFCQSLARLASYKHSIGQQDSQLLFQALNASKSGALGREELLGLLSLQEVKPVLAEFYSNSIDPAYLSKKQVIDFKKETSRVFLPVPRSNVSLENQLLGDTPDPSASDPPEPQRPLLFGVIKPKFGPLHKQLPRKGRSVSQRQPERQPVSSISRPKEDVDPTCQRQKIDRILRNGMRPLAREHRKETTASKLRTIFIRRIILPREQLFEQVAERERQRVGQLPRVGMRFQLTASRL